MGSTKLIGIFCCTEEISGRMSKPLVTVKKNKASAKAREILFWSSFDTLLKSHIFAMLYDWLTDPGDEGILGHRVISSDKTIHSINFKWMAMNAARRDPLFKVSFRKRN
jgi:hypothetical protein